MKLVHLFFDLAADASSDITPDPVRVVQAFDELHERIEIGLACRVIASRDGECPCGAEVQQLNRQQRRKMTRDNGGHPPLFTAYIAHEGGCPAMAEKTRSWLYQNRRKVRP